MTFDWVRYILISPPFAILILYSKKQGVSRRVTKFCASRGHRTRSKHLPYIPSPKGRGFTVVSIKASKAKGLSVVDSTPCPALLAFSLIFLSGRQTQKPYTSAAKTLHLKIRRVSGGSLPPSPPLPRLILQNHPSSPYCSLSLPSPSRSDISTHPAHWAWISPPVECIVHRRNKRQQ